MFNSSSIKFISGEKVPLEMHKAKIVKNLTLHDVETRKRLINEAGNNTFLLHNKDIFLDMLTDSGVNAMSDMQQSAMLVADDAYAGSESFFKLNETTKRLFGKRFLLPAHQGRACENILARFFVKQGQFTPVNLHFTTTRAHIEINGGKVVELPIDEAFQTQSNHPFKANMDLNKLEKFIQEKGEDKIAFVMMQAGGNLIGGQPFSLENLEEVSACCKKHGIVLILDASLWTDNLYFMKVREEKCKNMSLEEITLKASQLCDVVYFSARKLGSARGGAIVLDDEKIMVKMQEMIPVFEGFITYGGMSIMEIEAINIGLQESMNFFMINQGPEFIEWTVNELAKSGIPVVTPAGGLGVHLDAKKFVSHIPVEQYQAGALASAMFITGGIRGMERGTISEERNKDGSEHFAEVELLRLAMPRRVFTLSQCKFVVDRVKWLWENRELIGGLKWTYEPSVLRFFVGKLEPVGDWQDKLVAKFKEDFGESL